MTDPKCSAERPCYACGECVFNAALYAEHDQLGEIIDTALRRAREEGASVRLLQAKDIAFHEANQYHANDCPAPEDRSILRCNCSAGKIASAIDHRLINLACSPVPAAEEPTR